MIVAAKHLADVELYSYEAIIAIKKWLKYTGLAVAEDKTKAVLITARIRMRKHIITLKSAPWSDDRCKTEFQAALTIC